METVAIKGRGGNDVQHKNTGLKSGVGFEVTTGVYKCFIVSIPDQ